MIQIDEEIKAEILNNVAGSQDVNEVKMLARRYGSLCHENIVKGLRNTLYVKSKRDTSSGRLTGRVKIDASKLKDFLFSSLSQNVRGQSIRDERFLFIRELLNLHQDVEIAFMAGRDRSGTPFVSVRDMLERNFRDKITILERLIISTVEGVLNGREEHATI